MTKLDVRNIKLKLNLENIMKHQNDAISTRAWVKQMEKMQYNPILLFKCQGDEQSEGTDDLGKDDFALIIQTEFQRDALKKYGNNVILVDSTHGLTQYNFYLTTVMVIDEHGKAYQFRLPSQTEKTQLF